jgi:hypothetical protein
MKQPPNAAGPQWQGAWRTGSNACFNEAAAARSCGSRQIGVGFERRSESSMKPQPHATVVGRLPFIWPGCRSLQ